MYGGGKMPSKHRKSAELYEKACRVIPGGSQMYNKRPVIYEPVDYPIFADRSEGAVLYDLDGNAYIDYLLAYGAILLGYNYPPVQDAVIEQVKRGTIHSVNDPLEVELAEELVETIPCADMARYYLSGSEATTAAVRIARAHTGRHKVMKWGYHGWHDWTSVVRGGPAKGMVDYLHMINCPVESITHVPEDVSNHTIELPYNDLPALKRILEREGDSIACIIMEPFYFLLPDEGFLEGVIEYAHRFDIVVIFDEVKTGARVARGGAQEHFNVVPDMAVFSKAIANGYSFSLVVGCERVMRACEKLWFAGTNSGNSVGMRAALETVRESKRVGAVEHIWKLGERILEGLRSLVEQYDIEGVIGGIPPMPIFVFNPKDLERKKKMTSQYLSSLISRGIFMPIEHCFYISYSHSEEHIDKTLTAIEDAFKEMRKKG
jgi:glutamate-1-semialdehyde-2,1-aminomutase